eukprot:GFUD01023471.1.p1 GENE.GFUD01023471.1~~GFUD01023471.1.p1  ORF type:complete len:707 (+),score=124.40 GFUD01023471.1:348-2468(+)
MKLELESNLTYLPQTDNGMETEQHFTCNVCQRTFLQIDDLRKHNKNHLFSCADCNQAFNDQITLTKHQEEMHTQDKNFHCSQCDKSFKELRTLRLHLKIHNSDYPEHCEVCKKGFRTKWQLKQHLMDHGGKRPYPCPECSFTCKTKQQLNEHRRKHSGEKAYSCPLCGTRFTYRNGLIKHTKLNRCPKKIFTSDGEKLIKKKAKSMEQLNRQKIEMINNLASKSRAEKSVLDQKILDVIQKRSALKNQLGLPEINNIDANNNQTLLRRAALVQELQNNQMDPTNFTTQPPSSFGQAISSPVPFTHSLTSPTMSTTTTFLTNSTDISSWAATLPAGTKVTVTHYDASKKSGQGQLVATPTHTETIIVTPPKSETDISLIPLKSPKLQLPTSPLPLLQTRPILSPAHEKLIQDSQLITTPDEPKIFANIGQPSYPESFAVDPNDILLKNKPIKQEPLTLPSYQEANFNLSRFKLCNLPPVSPIDVQLTAQALLMNVKPDPNFDPNLKIKKEFEEVRSSISPSSTPSDMTSPMPSQAENWFPISNMNEIKKEVLDELFENQDETKAADDNNELQHPTFLVPQLSVKSEHDDCSMESDDFYNISLKMEPISPQSNSSISDTDHDSFSFHKDLDTIVASFGKATNKQNDTTVTKSEGLSNNPKSDFVLPDLDLDFSNFFDDNIGDINMNEQDFLQMRMDTFDACSEIMSNV